MSTLPRLRVPIGHLPQKLKDRKVSFERARLEVLRRLVTKVVREERIEVQWNRAIETRQYVERLIQIGIERGDNDPYASEMMDWWLMEPGLKTKMFSVLVPRLRDWPAPVTAVYRLPSQRLAVHANLPKPIPGLKYKEKTRVYELAVLEINGNPFPPVVSQPEDHSNNLLNVLLRKALERNCGGGRLQKSEEKSRQV